MCEKEPEERDGKAVERPQAVVVVPTHECSRCRVQVEHGKPCPTCGRLLLMD